LAGDTPLCGKLMLAASETVTTMDLKTVLGGNRIWPVGPV
jgi:hypothetical protein